MNSITSAQQTQAAGATPASGLWLHFIPVLLLLLFALQSIWFIRTQSLTYDEPAHIIAGTDAWQHGRFERWNDHPPLGRLWLTLPLARTPIDYTQQPWQRELRITAMQPGPEWLALRTRPLNTLLGLALGIALWFATRRFFSEGAANVALALFAFTPSLVAHFSLATTDGIGALFVFLVALQLIRWRLRPTAAQTLLMGLALGGLLLAKFYAPPLVALALILMLLLDRSGHRLFSAKWNWKPALAALAIAILLVWAGYFFHISRLTVGDGRVQVTYPNRPVRTYLTRTNVRVSTLVPAGEFFEGLREVIRNNHRGRPSWLLGTIHPRGGTPLYYPIAILLKWPTILLLLCVLSLAVGRAPRDLLLLLAFPLLYLLFALTSRYEIGERHILPLYPFALLIAGGIWEHARRSRAATMLVVLALCLNAADVMRYAPDYLSYFNFFVKPQASWRLLTDSNLDWGQGLIALRNYQRQHPGEVLHLACFGTVDPALYGLDVVPLEPEEKPAGKVVIGATLLSGQVLDDPEGYRWLWPYRPERVINHSLWMYDIR
ncbi:MAG TPA: glycosyltransferase family 39 protein [Candidatus Binatia bacterium]|nr:glycosyltransferase family 39 protein [Candidatus Binatia bacterium]